VKKCNLCGLLGARPIVYENSPDWYLCPKCEESFRIIRTYIQNKILSLHKFEYAYTNVCMLTRQTEIKASTPRKNMFVKINPQKILKYYSRGSGKTNNTLSRKDECAICKSKEDLTIHHLFKRAVFGERDNNCIVTLCLNCHVEIEKQITELEKSILKPLDGIFTFLQSLLLLKKISFEDRNTYLIYMVEKNGVYSFSFKDRTE